MLYLCPLFIYRYVFDILKLAYGVLYQVLLSKGHLKIIDCIPRIRKHTGKKSLFLHFTLLLLYSIQYS